MNILKKHKLNSLYEMSSGISSEPEQAGEGSPFLSYKCVFNNYFLPEKLNEKMLINDDEKKNLSIKEGDVYLTRTSETIDELGISSVSLNNYPDTSFSGFLKRLRPIKENTVYPKYMGFFFRSPYFRKLMYNNASLTLRASLNENIFSYLDIYLPEYSDQIKIGDFLHLISQKINLNIKICNELISISKIIYDYWFVQYDFPSGKNRPYKSSGEKMIINSKLNVKIPKDWELGELGSLIDILSGYPFKSETYISKGKFNILTIKNVQNHFLDISKCNQINDIPQNMNNYCMLNIGDILISLTGEVGRVCPVVVKNFLLNQRVGLIKAKKNYQDFIPYIYFLLHSEYIYRSLVNNSGGSNQDNLSSKKALKIKLIVPPIKIMKLYNDNIRPLFETFIVKQSENVELIKLQKMLISFFTSGKIKLN